MRHVMLGATPIRNRATPPVAPTYAATAEPQAAPRARGGMVGGVLAAMLCGVGIGMTLPTLERSAPDPIRAASARITRLEPVEAAPPGLPAAEETYAPQAQVIDPPISPPPSRREQGPGRQASRQGFTPPPIGSPGRPAPVVYEASAPTQVDRRVDEPRAPTREDLLAADRDLRRAWQDAVEAGAPRGLMVDYRRRWTQINRERAEDAAGLIRSYRQMTDELDRATFLTDDAVG